MSIEQINKEIIFLSDEDLRGLLQWMDAVEQRRKLSRYALQDEELVKRIRNFTLPLKEQQRLVHLRKVASDRTMTKEEHHEYDALSKQMLEMGTERLRLTKQLAERWQVSVSRTLELLDLTETN